MGSLSRNKGRAGEQEVVNLLKDELGVPAIRNYAQQAHTGGVDVLGVPGWAIEVKRGKEYINGWWTQTAEQAARVGESPVLLYRLDRRKWRARVCGCSVGLHHFQIDMDVMDWITLVREELNAKDETVLCAESAPL